jgi:hypothetical protein
MWSWRHSLVTILGAAALVGIPSVSNAQCGCDSDPTCKQFASTTDVFVAKVTESVRDDGGATKAVKLTVGQVFKGTPPAQVEFPVVDECDYKFDKQTEYLVYAQRVKDRLVVSMCSRTKPVLEAQEDIEWMQLSRESPSAGTIAGFLIWPPAEPGTRYEQTSLKVTLQSAEERFELLTSGPPGPFELNDLPAGTYQVTIWSLQNEELIRLPRPTILGPGMCLELDPITSDKRPWRTVPDRD